MADDSIFVGVHLDPETELNIMKDSYQNPPEYKLGWPCRNALTIDKPEHLDLTVRLHIPHPVPECTVEPVLCVAIFDVADFVVSLNQV